MTLKNSLKDFTENNPRKQLLEKDYTAFEKIAKAILNGYFEVSKGNTAVKFVKPTKVEFYYHEEYANKNDMKDERVAEELQQVYSTQETLDKTLLIKDYIVYHRNTIKDPEFPLFNVGTLNNHKSGIDITFEHKIKINGQDVNVRASALIRGFYVYTDRKECESGHPLPYKYISTKDLKYPEDRCTFLYDYLYGTSTIYDEGFTVKWIDCEGKIEPFSAPRVNVSQYQVNDNNTSVQKAPEKIQTTKSIKYVPDNRELQFYNEDFYL